MKGLLIKNLISAFFTKAYQTALLLLVANCLNGQPLRLFESVPARKSGVEFKNIITENQQHNALNYENLYNGGGVAILTMMG